jgi:DNA helicase HerA-like ATPase
MQWLFKCRLRRASQCAIAELAGAEQRQQEATARELAHLSETSCSAIQLGTTEWKQSVRLPAKDIANHSLIVGASGSGKSFMALNLICQMLDQLANSQAVTFGILDAKGELFERALSYVYAFLYRMKPDERERFKKRIVTIDFANPESLTPYNILAQQRHLADEIMVANRIDTISEQFAGLSEMSVRMKMILKYFLLLMTEFKLPLPMFETLCNDPVLLQGLVERSTSLQVKDYFLYPFDDESKATLLALRQRLESLFISESVRLSLLATTVPDFTQLQDKGAIILINTAGHNISRGVSQLLQNLLLSDLKQSVFRRTNPEQRVVWFLDEAQEIYKSRVNKEHMVDLLTMARSFGSFFSLITQSLTSAVRDTDVLNSILTNVRWLVMLRSTLRDAELIAPGLALTGRLTKSLYEK